MTDYEYHSSLFTIVIYLDHEEKLYKREVYSTLSMVGDIGGLFDGLFLITGFLLRWYSRSMFEMDFVKALFKFQKRLVNSSSENI